MCWSFTKSSIETQGAARPNGQGRAFDSSLVLNHGRACGRRKARPYEVVRDDGISFPAGPEKGAAKMNWKQHLRSEMRPTWNNDLKGKRKKRTRFGEAQNQIFKGLGTQFEDNEKNYTGGSKNSQVLFYVGENRPR